MKATSGSGIAILAQTSSGPFAVSASTSSNEEGAAGVFGQSQNWMGVLGETTTGNGTGVAGFASNVGVGTYGYSAGGYGVLGA